VYLQAIDGSLPTKLQSRSRTQNFTRLTLRQNGTFVLQVEIQDTTTFQVDGANFNNGFGLRWETHFPGGNAQPISWIATSKSL